MFGHRKGAFSGADQERPGLVRTAAGGTLFFDELGDLPHGAQAALHVVAQRVGKRSFPVHARGTAEAGRIATAKDAGHARAMRSLTAAPR